MKTQTTIALTVRLSAVGLAVLGLAQTGCNKPAETTGTGSAPAPAAKGKTTIQIQGSDTMVNLAQAWAEAYHKVKPGVGIEVGGGGSGVGIAALINGTIDIANSSRDMKPGEKEKAKATSGKDVKEITVGYDALAVFVHKNNPINEITLAQLKDIYAEGGKIAKWDQVGSQNTACTGDIIRVSRQSSSGTYEFFREHVLDKVDFKQGSIDQNGSKEVVDTIMNTPCAIGYSGMGYATPQVKMLKVSKAAGSPAYEPSVANAQNKTYPIARPLFLYTVGEPQGEVKAYIDWVLGTEGQKIVEQTGYVPLGSGK